MGITWLGIALSGLMLASSANTEDYILDAACPMRNKTCDLTITIDTKKNWRLKKQTPLKIDLQFPKAIMGTKTSFTQADLVLENDKRGKLRSKITSASSKLGLINMTASFYLCTAQICQRFQKTLKIELTNM